MELLENELIQAKLDAQLIELEQLCAALERKDKKV